MYLYSRDHVWVSAEGTFARIGISDFAQSELGEITYVELPMTGTILRLGDVACTLDSLKSASEVYSPVSGTVNAVNAAFAEGKNGNLINRDPLGTGWLYQLALSDPTELRSLMSEADYALYSQGS